MPGKVVEVDEEQFLKDQKLRNTIASWMNNPASKRKLLEAHKAFDPKAEIPELDQPDPLDAKLAPLMTEIADLKKLNAEEKAAREQAEKLASFASKIEAGIEKLRRTENLTPAGEAAVRKLMEDEGITNPEIAWSHFQRMHPPQAPIMPGGTGSWNFLEPPAEDQKDLQRLIETKGQNEGLSDKMARDVLLEIRGARR